jgi:GTPase SAR1 family protein
MPGFKVVLLGDAGVGKTAYIRRALHGRFRCEYKPTLSVEAHQYSVVGSSGAPTMHEGEPVTLTVYDVPGDEEHHEALRAVTGTADGAVLFYDSAESRLGIEKFWRPLLPEGCCTRAVHARCDLKSDAPYHWRKWSSSTKNDQIERFERLFYELWHQMAGLDEDEGDSEGDAYEE